MAAKKAKAKVEEKRIVLPIFNGANKQEKLQRLYCPDNPTPEESERQWYGCTRCDLHDYREKPDIVFGEGNPDADVVIIGEAPGEEEANSSYPFIGASGRLLNQLLAATSDDLGVQELYRWFVRHANSEAKKSHFHEKMFEYRAQAFFMTNMVGCRPPDNATPTPDQVKACWNRVWHTIAIVDPLIIIAAGKTALEALTGKKRSVVADRGSMFDITLPGRVTTMTYPMMPILHPSYLLRKADFHTVGGDYDKTEQDLLKAFRTLDGLRQAHYGIPIPERGLKK